MASLACLVNAIIWLIFLVIAFPVAGICAALYILLSPLQACCSGLTELNDFLLRGIQFVYFCADCMVHGKSVDELNNAFRPKMGIF